MNTFLHTALFVLLAVSQTIAAPQLTQVYALPGGLQSAGKLDSVGYNTGYASPTVYTLAPNPVPVTLVSTGHTSHIQHAVQPTVYIQPAGLPVSGHGIHATQYAVGTPSYIVQSSPHTTYAAAAPSILTFGSYNGGVSQLYSTADQANQYQSNQYNMGLTSYRTLETSAAVDRTAYEAAQLAKQRAEKEAAAQRASEQAAQRAAQEAAARQEAAQRAAQEAAARQEAAQRAAQQAVQQEAARQASQQAAQQAVAQRAAEEAAQRAAQQAAQQAAQRAAQQAAQRAAQQAAQQAAAQRATERAAQQVAAQRAAQQVAQQAAAQRAAQEAAQRAAQAAAQEAANQQAAQEAAQRAAALYQAQYNTANSGSLYNAGQQSVSSLGDTSGSSFGTGNYGVSGYTQTGNNEYDSGIANRFGTGSYNSGYGTYYDGSTTGYKTSGNSGYDSGIANRFGSGSYNSGYGTYYGGSTSGYKTSGNSGYGSNYGDYNSNRYGSFYGGPSSGYASGVTYLHTGSGSAAFQNSAANAYILRQSQDVGSDGSFQYSFETDNGINVYAEGNLKNAGTDNEIQVITGTYSYITPDGQHHTVHYVADENGFHARGEDLPLKKRSLPQDLLDAIKTEINKHERK